MCNEVAPPIFNSASSRETRSVAAPVSFAARARRLRNILLVSVLWSTPWCLRFVVSEDIDWGHPEREMMGE